MSQRYNKTEELNIPEVMDEGEQAALWQLNENQQAVDSIRAKNVKETHPDFDGESCIDCGQTIPANRLAIFKIRCIHCQTALEKREKMYNR